MEVCCRRLLIPFVVGWDVSLTFHQARRSGEGTAASLLLDHLLPLLSSLGSLRVSILWLDRLYNYSPKLCRDDSGDSREGVPFVWLVGWLVGRQANAVDIRVVFDLAN